MADWVDVASVTVAIVAAGIAAVQALNAKHSADRSEEALNSRKRDRLAVAQVIDPGNRLLEEIMAAKSKGPFDDAPLWARHRAWLDTVSETLTATDASQLAIWNARVDSGELEMATRTRLERLVKILERM